MKLLMLATALLVSACTPKIVQPKYDESLLKNCATPAKLEGKDGAAIMTWASTEGPGIVECVTNHNALVKIIKSSK